MCRNYKISQRFLAHLLLISLLLQSCDIPITPVNPSDPTPALTNLVDIQVSSNNQELMVEEESLVTLQEQVNHLIADEETNTPIVSEISYDGVDIAIEEKTESINPSPQSDVNIQIPYTKRIEESPYIAKNKNKEEENEKQTIELLLNHLKRENQKEELKVAGEALYLALKNGDKHYVNQIISDNFFESCRKRLVGYALNLIINAENCRLQDVLTNFKNYTSEELIKGGIIGSLIITIEENDSATFQKWKVRLKELYGIEYYNGVLSFLLNRLALKSKSKNCLIYFTVLTTHDTEIPVNLLAQMQSKLEAGGTVHDNSRELLEIVKEKIKKQESHKNEDDKLEQAAHTATPTQSQYEQGNINNQTEVKNQPEELEHPVVHKISKEVDFKEAELAAEKTLLSQPTMQVADVPVEFSISLEASEVVLNSTILKDEDEPNNLPQGLQQDATIQKEIKNLEQEKKRSLMIDPNTPLLSNNIPKERRRESKGTRLVFLDANEQQDLSEKLELTTPSVSSYEANAKGQHDKDLSETKEEAENQLTKDWEKFEINYDDSSDEEDIQKREKGYQLLEKTKEFQATISNNDFAILKATELGIKNFKHKYTLSFITHAMGLDIFYSKEVGEKYYFLKQNKLKQKFSDDFREELQAHINNSIKTIIAGLFLFDFEDIVPLYSNAINILIKDFKEKEGSFIKELEELIYEKIRYILKYEQVKEFPTELENIFENLKIKVKGYIGSLIKDNYAGIKQLFNKEKYSFPKPKELPTSFEYLQKNKDQYPILWKGLQDREDRTRAAIDTVIGGNHYVISSAGKIRTNSTVKRDLKTAINNPKTSNFDKEFLKEIQTLKSNPLMETFIKDNITKFSFLLFKSSLDEEQKRGTDSIIKVVQEDKFIKEDVKVTKSELKSYKSILHECIPLTPKRIGEIISKNIEYLEELENLEQTEESEKSEKSEKSEEGFNGIISISLQLIKDFIVKKERIRLPNLYEFDFEDQYSIPRFMANLRLCNRSAIRLIKNNKLFNGVPLSKQKQSRGCKFPASIEMALETQEITNQGNRADLVINNGKYEEVNAKIEGIKACGDTIYDQDIAFWIRETLRGNPLTELSYVNGDEIIHLEAFQLNEIKRVIVDITYLLFGTEVVRNPASLIHHNMMLDLIINENYTWASFLSGEKPMLPMELKGENKNDKYGAVRCARTLHTAYNRLMPYKYTYPKDALELGHDKVVELIAREGSLTLEWLRHCAKVKIDMSKDITDAMLCKIINALKDACQEWFGFSVGRRVYIKSVKVVKKRSILDFDL